MHTAFPTTPEQLDAPALNALLGVDTLQGTRAEQVRCQDIGVGQGLLGRICRATVSYDRPGPLPPSFVVKFPAQTDDARATAAAGHLYRREFGFFDELAPGLSVSIPRCWAARYNPSTDDFVLVLDDIAPIDDVDQLAGCSIAQAEGTIRELARLHAAWWDRTELEHLDWVPGFATAGRIDNLSSLARRGWPLLMELGADLVPPGGRRFGDELAERVPDYLHRLDSLTPTLLHGDPRLDNLLFRRSETSPVIVDWQGLSKGPGMLDVGYFLTQSLTVDDRKQNATALVDAYRHELIAQGVEHPSTTDLSEGFRLATRFSLIVACSVPVLADGDEPRVRALARSMLERSVIAILDLEPGAPS